MVEVLEGLLGDWLGWLAVLEIGWEWEQFLIAITIYALLYIAITIYALLL